MNFTHLHVLPLSNYAKSVQHLSKLDLRALQSKVPSKSDLPQLQIRASLREDLQAELVSNSGRISRIIREGLHIRPSRIDGKDKTEIDAMFGRQGMEQDATGIGISNAIGASRNQATDWPQRCILCRSMRALSQGCYCVVVATKVLCSFQFQNIGPL